MVGFHNLGGGASDSLLGHLCLLGNTFGAGVYFLFQKPLISRGYRPLMITGYGYGSGALWVVRHLFVGFLLLLFFLFFLLLFCLFFLLLFFFFLRKCVFMSYYYCCYYLSLPKRRL